MARKTEVLIDSVKPHSLWTMPPAVSQLYDNLSRYLELLCKEDDILWDRKVYYCSGTRCEMKHGRAFVSVLFKDSTVRLHDFHGMVYFRISNMSVISTWFDEVINDKKRKKGIVPSLFSVAKIVLGRSLVEKTEHFNNFN